MKQREELRERGGRSAARVSRVGGHFETTWRELRVGRQLVTRDGTSPPTGDRDTIICRLPRMVGRSPAERSTGGRESATRPEPPQRAGQDG